MIEKGSLTAPYFPLAASSNHIRMSESVLVVTRWIIACQG